MSGRTRSRRSGWRASLIRWPMRAIDRLRRTWRHHVPRKARGVRAVAVTPAGRVVLVRHSYVPGWYCPGGGIRRGETVVQAAERELREEIGMASCAAITLLDEGSACATGVVYRARLSLEIEEIADFDPNSLPDGTTPRTRRLIARAIADTDGDGPASDP